VSLPSLERTLLAGSHLLLDSTALVSYFKGTERASPVAAHIVQKFVITGRNPATVSTITAMELLVDPIQRGDDVFHRQVSFFLLYTPHLQLAPVDFRVAREAAHLRALLRFKPPDALVAATGRILDAEHLVCNDAEWKRKLRSAQRDMPVCYLEDHLPFP
jgi:hypothetical protein